MNQNTYGTPYGGSMQSQPMGMPYNYGQSQPMGMPYGVQSQSMPVYNSQPVKQPEYTNPLGATKIKELLQKGNGAPKLVLTEDDYTEAICTHRYNGHIEANEMNDGTGRYKCKICGAEFVPVEEATQEDVRQATENLMNILHTAKLAWLDVPDKTCTEFFQALAIVKKTPELFKIAMNNYAKYNGYQIQSQSSNVSGFGIFNQILGPQSTQPYYGNNQVQPYGQSYNQPVLYNTGYAQPMPIQGYGQDQALQMKDQDYYNNQAAQQMQQAATGISNGFGFTVPNIVSPAVQSQQGASVQPQNNTSPSDQQNGVNVNKQLHI